MTRNKKIIIIAVIVIIFVGIGLGYLVYRSNTIPEGGAEKEQACIDSGGEVSIGRCRKSTGNFFNTCLIGPCVYPSGFLNDLLYSYKVKFCNCGSDKCFNGEKCVLFEERSADAAVVAFMDARIQRDEELALSWLTNNAKEQYAFLSELSLVGLSNPHFADFELFDREELDGDQLRIRVRIYEEYTGRGEVGFFDETLTVIKIGDKYLIDSVERSSYVSIEEISGWQTYKNEEHGFEVKYPEEADTYPGDINVFNKAAAHITIRTDNNRILEDKKLFIVPFKYSPDDKCSKELLAEGQKLNIKEREDIEVNGINFFKELEEGEGENYTAEIFNYSASKNSVCVVLIFSIAVINDDLSGGSSGEFDLDKETEVFDQILSTFRFLK